MEEMKAEERRRAIAKTLTAEHPVSATALAGQFSVSRQIIVGDIALLRAALGSVADRAIIPMYDWLGLGAEAHLNTPGKLGGNWAWRAADGFAAKALAKTIHDECSVYCRV